MANQKKNPKATPELSEHEAEALIYKAFNLSGAFLPQTPEEVEAAQANIDEERIELPPSLRDPLVVLDRAKKLAEILPFPARPAVDTETIENLACAAKNGSEIPPEVLARMEADEQEAKAKREEGNAEK